MGELMENFETVSPAEREYFASRGEKPIPTGDDAPVETEAEAAEPEIEIDEPEANEGDAPEPEAKDEQPEEQPKKKDQRIPLRKLQESENQRKELERRLAEVNEKFTRADERMRALFEAQQPKPETPQPPDPREDPIGAIEYTRQQMEAFQQQQARQAAEYQQQQQLSALDNTYRQSWGQFANAKPDAIDAYNHFISVTGAFLEMQGAPQEQINQLIENEERKIAYAAMQRGLNPAELIYERAKTMGYAPKAAAPVEDDSAARKADADIERRQKAAGASKSLGAASGTRSASMPSMQELAEMSEDEYADFRAKIGERKWQKLMGG